MGRLRLAVAAALLPLALSACGGGETPSAPALKANGPKLALIQVSTADWKDVSAEIATVDQAQVLARIPGILSSLTVKEGDLVRKGQVIGRIVDSQLGYQAAAHQAQATQAKAELDRTKFLFDNGVYSKARLDAAQAAADAAEAQLRAAQAVSGQGAVVAPASGRVLMADIPPGSPVVSGMAIATITAGPTVLKLELPETLAGKVHRGSLVRAKMPGAEGEGDVSGAITKIYPAVTGGQVRADARVPGLDNALIGRRVSAQVETGQRKALLVPEDYVTTAYGIDTVWVADKADNVSSVPVQTAPSDEKGKLEILSGVGPGDVLVKQAAQKAAE
jgi:RND family efflux transporter MFP subunit